MTSVTEAMVFAGIREDRQRISGAGIKKKSLNITLGHRSPPVQTLSNSPSLGFRDRHLCPYLSLCLRGGMNEVIEARAKYMRTVSP